MYAIYRDILNTLDLVPPGPEAETLDRPGPRPGLRALEPPLFRSANGPVNAPPGWSNYGAF